MKPKAMRAFDALYLGAVGVSAIDTMLSFDQLKTEMQEKLVQSGAEQFGDTALIGGLVVSFVITLSLWFLVSVLRVEFVKWVIALFAVWGMIPFFRLAASKGFDGIMVAGLIVLAMNLAAAALLFTPAVTAWFRAARNPPDTQ